MSHLRTEPLYVHKVWGGDRFSEFAVEDVAEPIGELWTASDQNLVCEGPYAGTTLKKAITELGEAFLGPVAVARYGVELPLITKFINTGAWLSVQVHPDDAFAHQEEAATGFHGKTEAWLMLEVGPNGEMAYGLNTRADPSQLRQWIDDGVLLEKLNHLRPEPGQVYGVPAGTIHALGPGLLLYEVQQRSELTYRMFDYGRNRPLHIDKALAVACGTPTAPEPAVPWQHDGNTILFAEHDFVVMRHDITETNTTITSPADSFSIVTRVNPIGETWVLAAGTTLEPDTGTWLQSFMASL